MVFTLGCGDSPSDPNISDESNISDDHDESSNPDETPGNNISDPDDDDDSGNNAPAASEVHFFTLGLDATNRLATKHIATWRGLDTVYAIGMGDFDNDGDYDALISEYPRMFVVDLEHGGQKLWEPDIEPTGHPKLPTLIGDLNGDGDLDFITLSYNAIEILIGREGASFELVSFAHVEDVGSEAKIALGDVNNDGSIDLVLANDRSSSGFPSHLRAWLNNGEGTAFEPAEIVPDPEDIGAPRLIHRLELIDVDEDGNLDIVSLNSPTRANAGNDSSIGIQRGLGDGSFESVTYQNLDGSPSIDRFAALRDYTGDGIADVVGCGNPGCIIAPGNEDGTFAPSADLDAGNFYQVKDIAAHDVNGDGAIDLLIAGANRLDVITGDGAGEFTYEGRLLSDQRRVTFISSLDGEQMFVSAIEDFYDWTGDHD